jgi:hypothetical protein
LNVDEFGLRSKAGLINAATRSSLDHELLQCPA